MFERMRAAASRGRGSTRWASLFCAEADFAEASG